MQLTDQECQVKPLNIAPILGQESSLSVVSALGKVGENRQIPVIFANATGRDYTHKARFVTAIAEVLEDPEYCR